MAILREGITVGNNLVDQINSTAKELASISNDIISYLCESNLHFFEEPFLCELYV